MKKLVFILVMLVNNVLYSQINFDTLFVTNVVQTTDNISNRYILKISNGMEYVTNVKTSVGDIFGYYDSSAHNFVPKWEYENSLFEKLYFSEYLWTFDSKPVVVVSRSISLDNKYKYEIVTNSDIVYYTNYPPNVGDVVFHINNSGQLINVSKPFKFR